MSATPCSTSATPESVPPWCSCTDDPRTGATWQRVAAALLAAGLSVVVPDLRGYGQSSKPPTTADHAPYSKRVMAGNMRRLMTMLGHETFLVVGHDRGSYVGFLLANGPPRRDDQHRPSRQRADHEALERCDETFAHLWWHWFFFAQPQTPECVVNGDPDAWYKAHLTLWARRPTPSCGPRPATRDPETVHAMLEDKSGRPRRLPRARPTSSRARAQNHVPATGVVVDARRPGAAVRRLRGHGIESGHHMAEEAPDNLVDALLRHLVAG